MTAYLDHAATTPLRPDARDAWIAASALVGNASSVHRAGQSARRVLEESREAVAAALDCEPIEVVFTSGGTESVNLALKGLWWAHPAGAIVVPDGEHHATTATADWLEAAAGAELRRVALEPDGTIPLDRFAAALPGAALATALVAGNEIGTIQDAAALAEAAATAGVPLHLDAVGAVGWLDVSFARWRGEAEGPAGLVALSVSGHKLGAPTGTGALVLSRHAAIAPLVHGGGQQRGVRSGSPDFAGAAALAAAATAAVAERERTAARVSALRDRLRDGILRLVPDAELLGHATRRLPGNLHVLFPGALGETLLFLLDTAGIAASTGSACQAGVAEPSHVVLALGRDERDARSVLRFTLGRTSTDADVDAVLAALPEAHRRAVAAGSTTRPRS
ncbi:cysteine desulfurase family protein [Microbacterium sp.]|uniref:cysteine desulfurase family protein n=1 Tax=Microbacterium sp. TaxID=51671 RepID=UPI0039E41273